jgi:hypothetical protein
MLSGCELIDTENIGLPSQSSVPVLLKALNSRHRYSWQETATFHLVMRLRRSSRIPEEEVFFLEILVNVLSLITK